MAFLENLKVSLYDRAGRLVTNISLIEFEISGTVASPAMVMTAKFSCSENPGELRDINAEADGYVLFYGYVDSKRFKVDSSGCTLTVEARTRGRMLLDNEAAPGVLYNVSFATVFAKYIAPYGFYSRNAYEGRGIVTPVYTVTKGMSEWEAFSGWIQCAYGENPCAFGERVYVGGFESGSFHRLSNAGYGIPYTLLEESFSPADIISQIFIRDDEGAYSSCVESAEAAYYNIRRKRYLVPGSEFSHQALYDARQLLESSFRECRSAAAEMPGIVKVRPGDSVEIADHGMQGKALYVREWGWRGNGNGFTTGIVMN